MGSNANGKDSQLVNFKQTGVVPALLTMFNRGGRKIDVDATLELARWLVKKGVSGLFVNGTTGEGLIMTVEERKMMVEAVMKECSDKIPITVQTGSISGLEAVELTRHARDVGAHAASAVMPFFYRQDDPAIENYYRKVAATVPGLPLLIYNLPSCTGTDLSAPLAVRLVETVDNIVGVKESSGSLVKIQDLLRLSNGKVCVGCGEDLLTLPALLTGASFSVTGVSNAFPEPFVATHKAFHSGDMVRAKRYQRRIVDACNAAERARLIAVFKEALRLRGLPSGSVRLPNRELTRAEKKVVARRMKELGFI
jgi:dihydrodipicolinate synthase/N-acetylneuraminate lyase